MDSGFMRTTWRLLLLLLVFSQGCQEDSCDAEEAWALDQIADQEEQEEFADIEVTLLQTQLTQQRGAVAPAAAEEKAAPAVADDTSHVMSVDHAGKVCMLCNRPPAERLGNRTYDRFLTDCGHASSASGPSAEAMAIPAVQLWKKGAERNGANGFCALNFAKSCADAVANKDYTYFAKSIDFHNPSLRSNIRWDGRYCRLNGFLEPSVLKLQHNFTALQEHASMLCETKYSKHGIERLTFLDMLELSRQESPDAPSLLEAEKMAAWNCAMGELGCDIAMCAYSFCNGTDGRPGLYGECEGWDPQVGMPFRAAP